MGGFVKDASEGSSSRSWWLADWSHDAPCFMRVVEPCHWHNGRMALLRMVGTWSFAARAIDAAWREGAQREDAREAGRSESLDAVERACIACERDPEVDSVGLGGLPDSSGRVSLDGCVMLGPARCGSVAGLRTHLHPVSVARKVMEHSAHVMLVGPDADAFADVHGLSRSELLAPRAAEAFEAWKRTGGVVDQSRDRAADAGASASTDESRWRYHDTIGCLALDSRGVLAGACSTSGTPYKVPGRVGDSPIIGHGLYIDPDLAAVTATGTGELIMGVCGSFLVVEAMRRGATALDAAREALERITRSYALLPHHQVAFLVLAKNGEVASASLRPGYRTSVRDATSARVIEPEWVAIPDARVTEATA